MNRQEITNWLNEMGIYNYHINEDLSVDVNGNVDLYKKSITHFPFQFGHINGFFNCSYNNLTSLRGCPKEISGGFYCSNNNLTSLKYRPEKVTKCFGYHNNPINEAKSL